MMRIYYIFYLLIMTLLLSSCGTKGTLYVPEEKYPQAMIQEKIYVTKFLVVT